MEEDKSEKQEESGNIYDKIFKENAVSIFVKLIEIELNIEISSSKPLPEKMQTTTEREMDFCYEVKTTAGEEFILHLEFQKKGSKEMIYRIGEHHGMTSRRFKKPIKHIVIYLGKGKSRMPTRLPPEQVYTGFHILNLSELDVQPLLDSDKPELVMLSILGKTGKQKEEIVRSVLKRLSELCPEKNQRSICFSQLLIIARLRNLEAIIIKTLKDMPITIDVEKDYLYNMGVEEGIEKGREEGREKGIEEGIDKGFQKGIKKVILTGWEKGFSAKTLSAISGLSLRKVKAIIREKYPDAKF